MHTMRWLVGWSARWGKWTSIASSNITVGWREPKYSDGTHRTAFTLSPFKHACSMAQRTHRRSIKRMNRHGASLTVVMRSPFIKQLVLSPTLNGTVFARILSLPDDRNWNGLYPAFWIPLYRGCPGDQRGSPRIRIAFNVLSLEIACHNSRTFAVKCGRRNAIVSAIASALLTGCGGRQELYIDI